MSRPSVMTVRPVDAVTDLVPVPAAGGKPACWRGKVIVEYVLAEHWRPARDGELCRYGAGGRGLRACKAPAVVTFESRQPGRVVPYPYCGEHHGGRVVLDDGRVVEPAEVDR